MTLASRAFVLLLDFVFGLLLVLAFVLAFVLDIDVVMLVVILVFLRLLDFVFVRGGVAAVSVAVHLRNSGAHNDAAADEITCPR